MKLIEHPIAFRLFLIAWNQAQGMTSPKVHRDMADWLHARWESGDRRLLLMAFRSCGKSSVVGVFAAWLLYACPDLRILVLAAEGSLARKMVRNVRKIIEKHPLTGHLVPANAEQWAGERFTVARRLELRDPSMAARGMDANITGTRADVIICDDVEVPKTAATADKREALREKLDELNFILAPGGTIVFTGTPHSWYTIYANEARVEIGEAEPYLKDYTRYEVPILDAEGRSAWPERYSVEEIETLRQRAGPNRFTSQMMLIPVNVEEGHLDIALLRRYSAEIDYTKELDRLEIGGRRMVDCCAFWDPALAGRDASVVAIAFISEDHDIWLHRVVYLRKGSNVDPLGNQVGQLALLLQMNHVPLLTVETNGIGATLPKLLRKELGERNIPCVVMGRPTTDNKNTRIQEALDTVMAAGMLHVHEQVYSTAFIREMQEWTPKSTGGRDDGLDAVASALRMRQPRVAPGKAVGRRTWQDSSKMQTAKTEFEV
ncbi:MAG: hypothetical protein JWO78_1043 [Micavibrio sp.]|nr:hypothetical protein [Micavibrio sp.]